MKRVNIYITEDTDKKIDTLSELFQVNRSEIMRRALSEFSSKHEDELNDFVSDLDEIEQEVPDGRNRTEFIRECRDNPEFFIENCIRINTMDNGISPFQLYKYQKQLLFKVDTFKRIIMNTSRQIGLSSLMAAHMLHHVMFNEDKTAVCVMPTQSQASHFITQLGLMVHSLPQFMKEGLIQSSNKKSIIFSNGSRIMGVPATPDSIRGFTIDYMFIDLFSHIPRTVADSFREAIFPTILSRKNYKLVVASTPNGMNHFFKMWADAISNYNSFHAIKLPYHLIESRDEKWALDQKMAIGDTAFGREFNCEFHNDQKGDLYAI